MVTTNSTGGFWFMVILVKVIFCNLDGEQGNIGQGNIRQGKIRQVQIGQWCTIQVKIRLVRIGQVLGKAILNKLDWARCPFWARSYCVSYIGQGQIGYGQIGQGKIMLVRIGQWCTIQVKIRLVRIGHGQIGQVLTKLDFFYYFHK